MNFALILFILSLVTGALWLFNRYHAAKQRAEGAPDPWWVEYGASFFPVIVAVFLLRSFLVEPFKIPSGSMLPTLLVGDFILVNKYTYGLRLPVINKKIVDLNDPQRGDVVVFRYPPDPSLDYIKRVVGVPGDTVEYRNKQLSINGQLLPQVRKEDYLDTDRLFYTPRFTETGGTVRHDILVEADAPNFIPRPGSFKYQENCQYNSQGFQCVVPAGHLFVMGDNRDNSQDSRFWGFVPDENLVGKAFFIWFNFSNLKRIGSFE
jgi:signal peptidase I